MVREDVIKTLQNLGNFEFDIEFMNNKFDYEFVWNKLNPNFHILITRENYRKALNLFIDGKVNNEMLRAWVYYMDETLVFTTNMDLYGEEDDALLDIRDQISATSINGPLTVDMVKNFLKQIEKDWNPLLAQSEYFYKL